MADSQALAYFETGRAAFEQAARRAGSTEAHAYALGRYVLRVAGAGPGLVRRLVPALAHLQAPSVPPPTSADLTIHVWDGASTGVCLPPPPWYGRVGTPEAEVYGHHAGRVETRYTPETGILSLLDHDRATALFYAPSPDVPFHVAASPFRTILSWWLRPRRWLSVHAAAVGTPAGGALLAGRSGSGKSTTALTCLASPLAFAGDDYVALSTEGPLFVHSLYSAAKLEREGLRARLPHLLPMLDNADRLDEEKGVVYLHRHLPEKLSPGFPVRALLLPRVTAERLPRLRRVGSAAGLLGFAPSSLLPMPGHGPEQFAALAGAVRQLPVFVLDLGAEMAGVPDLIQEAIAA